MTPVELSVRLTAAIRQFRHNNDNSPSVTDPDQGFVVAYDKDEIDQLVGELNTAPKVMVAQPETNGIRQIVPIQGVEETIPGILVATLAPQNQLSTPDPVAEWLVYNTTRAQFWKARHEGYTNDITEAGRYSFQDAQRYTRFDRRTFMPINLIIPVPEHE